MWLYDPRTNILKEMTVYEIGDLHGLSASNISRAAQRGNKLSRINCYVFKMEPSLKTRKQLYESETYQGEVWKQYKDTRYEVSNYGRVRKNYKTTTVILLPFVKRKYMTVKIEVGERRVEKRLRDIVAEVFLKKEIGKECIVHKNGNYTDCSVWNIARASRSEVARRTGGKSRSKAVVLIDEDTQEVVEWWQSARKAAADNYMSYQAINDRCNGKVQSRKEGYFMWEEDYEELFFLESAEAY